MATSGSFTTSEYTSSSGKKKGLRFSWERTNYNIAENWSEITWTWKGYSSNSSSGYHILRSSYLNINGSSVYAQGSGTKELYNDTDVASGTTRIYHNADGSKHFGADGGGAIYVTSINCTGSNEWDLDTIPRAPSYNSISASNVTETSVRLTASIDTKTLSLTDGGWDVSTDGGATWTYYSGGTTDKTITGLTPNTKYWYRGYAVTAGGGANSGWQDFTTYDYPKPTSVSSGNIGNAFTVNVSNPLNRSYTLQLISNNDGSTIGSYSGSINGNVTGFNDSTTINKFYQSIPSTNRGSYYAKVIYNGNNRTKGNGTYDTVYNDCKPTFTTFTYKDSNSSVSSVTSNNQILVKGLSTLQVTISSSNKMTTQKYATPNKYAINCDTLNKEETYSSSTITSEVGTITGSGTKRLTVTAYDSRNNGVSPYKDITVLDYAKPVINAIATRLNDFEDETTLKVSGTYTKLTIGNTDKNTITSVQYRYRETGGTWSSWTNITYTTSNGTYTCSDVILSLDNTKSFEFEIKVVDNLQTNTISTNVDIGQAIFFISTNNRACYINGQEILQYDVVDTW